MTDKALIGGVMLTIVATIRAESDDAYIEPRQPGWWTIDGNVDVEAVAEAVIETIRDYDHLLEHGKPRRE